MGAPEFPPLLRETSISRSANVGTVGKNWFAKTMVMKTQKGKYLRLADGECLPDIFLSIILDSKARTLLYSVH